MSNCRAKSIPDRDLQKLKPWGNSVLLAKSLSSVRNSLCCTEIWVCRGVTQWNGTAEPHIAPAVNLGEAAENKIRKQNKTNKKICWYALCNEKGHRLKSQILWLLIKRVASGNLCVLKLRFWSDALFYCRGKGK